MFSQSSFHADYTCQIRVSVPKRKQRLSVRFETVRTGRKVGTPKALQTSGTMGILTVKILKFTVSEMPFPAFFVGHFHGILKYEGKCCEGAGREDYIFSFFTLPVCLRKNKRIEKTLSQRH